MAHEQRPPTSGGEIAGARWIPLHENPDDRGSFLEVYAEHWELAIDPRQWSVVRSRPGVFRGMHLHRRHEEYLHVVSGHLTVGLHDIRPDSPTFGVAARFDLDGDDPSILVFPRGIVHGWLATDDVVHLQAVSEEYLTYHADDNMGCRWDDPHLGIDWPSVPTRMSERAEGFGTLAELVEVMRER